MLTMDLNKTLSKLSQLCRRRQVAVHERSATTGARNFATDENLVAVAVVLEDRFNRGLRFAGTNQVGGSPCAKQQADRLDDDGLPCAGLAGQHVEAGLELDLDGLNHRKVADAKQAQHVGGTSIVSYV